MFGVKKEPFKFICICVVSIIISLILEIVCFNFNAITKSDSLNIGVNECVVEETYISHIYRYSFDTPRYVDKLVLMGTATENVIYNMLIEYENPFGVTESYIVDDTILFTNSAHYTYINKNISSIQVTVPKSDAEIYVNGFGFLNQFHINKYRLMVVFSILFILGNVVCYSGFYHRKPELFFVLTGILMGFCMIMMQGTTVMGWDEEVHFRTVHSMLSEDPVENSVSTKTIDVANTLVPDTWEEKGQLIQYYNENADYQKELETYKEDIRVKFNVGYIPQAFFYKTANMIGLGFNQCYMAGRFGNLLFYLFVIYIAIRIVKDGKMILACMSLMPTSLYIATLYTYDSFVYALLILGFVLIYNQWLCDYNDNKLVLSISIVLFVVGSLPKAVYIPIVLLALTLLAKDNQQRHSRRNKILLLGICLAFVIVMATFAAPVLSGVITGDTSIGGDPRGGETNYVWQLLTILEHPLAYVKMLIHDIFSVDNFRNFGFVHLDEVLFTNVGFLSMGRYGVMPDKYVCLFIPYIICLLIWSRNKNVDKKYCKISFGIFAVIVVLIWTAMYMAFTPVGLSEIAGVQVRYYLPLLIPTMLLLPSYRIKIENVHISKDKKIKILFLGIWFFLSYCLYFIMFKSACI